jgi:hypothetical protein
LPSVGQRNRNQCCPDISPFNHSANASASFPWRSKSIASFAWEIARSCCHPALLLSAAAIRMAGAQKLLHPGQILNRSSRLRSHQMEPDLTIAASRTLWGICPGITRRGDSQSTEPAAPEKTLVRRVLLDVGSFALFRGIGMMFMLYRFPFQHFGVTPSILLAAISWRDRRHAARHEEIQMLL